MLRLAGALPWLATARECQEVWADMAASPQLQAEVLGASKAEAIHAFISYIERVWTGTASKKAQFDWALWTISHRRDSDTLTTNASEGYHSRWKSAQGGVHPPFERFLLVVRRQIAASHLLMSEDAMGGAPPKKTRAKRQEVRNRQIRNLMTYYEQGSIQAKSLVYSIASILSE